MWYASEDDTDKMNARLSLSWQNRIDHKNASLSIVAVIGSDALPELGEAHARHSQPDDAGLCDGSECAHPQWQFLSTPDENIQGCGWRKKTLELEKLVQLEKKKLNKF